MALNYKANENASTKRLIYMITMYQNESRSYYGEIYNWFILIVSVKIAHEGEETKFEACRIIHRIRHESHLFDGDLMNCNPNCVVSETRSHAQSATIYCTQPEAF